MSATATRPTPTRPTQPTERRLSVPAADAADASDNSAEAVANPSEPLSTGEQLRALGWEVNANQYRCVHLAARFDEELEWFRWGLKSASHWIAEQLQIQSSTAREWIRVGHALRHLPLIDAALAAQEISYAKARILTRWADTDNEEHLLALAYERSANRLTTAIARALADDGETDEAREARLHEGRAVTTWTDGDGMGIMRITLPPSVLKPIAAAVDELVDASQKHRLTAQRIRPRTRLINGAWLSESRTVARIRPRTRPMNQAWLNHHRPWLHQLKRGVECLIPCRQPCESCGSAGNLQTKTTGSFPVWLSSASMRSWPCSWASRSS